MIVFGIVFVRALAHESDQEVSVDAFIVMQRNEIQIVKPEHRRDHQDHDHTDLPNAFRNIGGNNRGRRRSGRGSLLLSREFLLLPGFLLT